jgi:tellurite resistance protein TerC
MTPVEHPLWVWILFFSVVLIALFVDIGIVNRTAHVPTRRETIGWSLVWVSLAISFNIFIYWQIGYHHRDWDLALVQAKLFLTGYLIELSLSVDNLFLVERFHWIIYVFGAFLIYTGLKMFQQTDENFEPHESAIVRFATKYIRISRHYEGDRFFVIKDGVRTGTLLLLVLITVEFTDLIFAVDSIPAIFGITTDKFIVYTSNIFAILGLRTFFFLLADLADRFHFLKYGLAFILTFIGIKMLLPLLAQGLLLLIGSDSASSIAEYLRVYLDPQRNHHIEQLVINISLGVVVASIAVSVILSLIIPPKKAAAEVIADVEEESTPASP